MNIETPASEKKLGPVEKAQRQIAVTVLRASGKSVLVSWVDTAGQEQRGWLPADKLSSTLLREDVVSQAAPYGLPWAELLAPRSISAEELEHALRNAGVWTGEDAARHPSAVIGALQAVYQIDLAAVLSAANKATKKKED